MQADRTNRSQENATAPRQRTVREKDKHRFNEIGWIHLIIPLNAVDLKEVHQRQSAKPHDFTLSAFIYDNLHLQSPLCWEKSLPASLRNIRCLSRRSIGRLHLKCGFTISSILGIYAVVRSHRLYLFIYLFSCAICYLLWRRCQSECGCVHSLSLGVCCYVSSSVDLLMPTNSFSYRRMLRNTLWIMHNAFSVQCVHDALSWPLLDPTYTTRRVGI